MDGHLANEMSLFHAYNASLRAGLNDAASLPGSLGDGRAGT